MIAVALAAEVLVGTGIEDGRATVTSPVPIPARRITDLAAAARTAGCRLRSFRAGPGDRRHVFGAVRYRQNPPVLGPHAPLAASDGSYTGRSPPPTEEVVHALEHGRVAIQYRPGLAQRRVGQLETLFLERPKPRVRSGYKTLLFENRTGMTVEVAATAWGHQLVCPRFTDRSFDALRAFRTAYVDKAPQSVPG